MKNLFSHARVLFSIAGLALCAISAYGQTKPGGQSDQGGGEHEHRGPPPEAIAACKGLANGATCSFTGYRGEQLSGACFSPPAGGLPPQGNQSAGAQGGQQGAGKPMHNADVGKDKPMACRPNKGAQGNPPPQK